MKMLIVDDSRFVRFTVLKLLKESVGSDHIYLEAASGEEAIALFKQDSPDIIFLDFLMPDLTGEDVLKEIRRKDNSCFVVMLTSNFQKQVKERVLNLGANLFVEKAITKEKIISIIESFHSKNS